MASAATIPEAHRPGVRAALGPSAKMYAVAAARVYVCGPGDSGWSRVGTGALVFGSVRRPGAPKAFLLCLVAVDPHSAEFGFEARARWGHEIGNVASFGLREERPHFHAFDMGDGTEVGLLFASPGEASAFAGILCKRLKRAAKPGFFARLFGSGSRTKGSEKPMENERQGAMSSEATMASVQPDRQVIPPAPKAASNTRPKAAQSTRSSVGYDPSRGAIDEKTVPEEWREVFARAGVTHEQLAAPETAAVIARFCADNSNAGGKPAVPPRRHKPPVAAPVVPPKAGAKTAVNVKQPAIDSAIGDRESEKPTATTEPQPAGGRDALLASIRKASLGSLRHVESSAGSRESLGASEPAETSDPQDIMAEMLSKALAARNRRMAHSSDDE